MLGVVESAEVVMSGFVSASVRAQRVVEGVSGGKLPLGFRLSEVTLWGVEVVLVYRLNEEEHARRTAVGGGPLDDLGMLDALLKLPVKRPTLWSSLAGRDQRLLRRGESSHAWVRRGDLVERLAVPPLSVDLAVVRAEHARVEGLDAMPFGAYVPQAMWLDCPAGGSQELLAEAVRFSTGVVHWQGVGEPRVLAPAEPLVEVWETSAGWRFAEHAYGQILGLPAAPGLVSPFRSPTG
ncbi:hypothetical protein ACFVXC_16115 [Streptomyces sp. NPDC058257]|uniref:hypothetical protein n=1 Tax=Streptomyces sp. NPDC058257 TaxID=3346409 RepID=UPI0036E68A97